MLSPWATGIARALTSLLSVVALFVFLRVYEGRPLSGWEALVSRDNNSINVSINFIVSTLGTVSRSAFAKGVAAGLPQSKWLWFVKRKHSLVDFKTCDKASRGSLGNMQLLGVTELW